MSDPETGPGTGPGTGPETGSDKRWYGRRHGRKLRPGRRALLDDALPRLRVADAGDTAPLDLAASFAIPPRAFWLEIGFGTGEHLAALAARHPDIGFIGCEPFVNGVAALVQKITDEGLTNVRIFDDDMRLLLPRIADASIERLYVLFPDPWPKSRHHRRRITVPENLAQFARLLADDGRLLFASDQHGFAAWSLANLLAARDFTWTARSAKDWRRPPDDWVATRYQEKARAKGLEAVFLDFRRRRRGSAERLENA